MTGLVNPSRRVSEHPRPRLGRSGTASVNSQVRGTLGRTAHSSRTRPTCAWTDLARPEATRTRDRRESDRNAVRRGVQRPGQTASLPRAGAGP